MFFKNSSLMMFAMIGVLITFVHCIFVMGFVELLNFNPVIANIIAFCISNIFYYLMNCICTFAVVPSRLGYLKFLLGSVSSFILTVTFSALAEYMDWHYLVGLLLIIVISPLITFLVYKSWVFRNHHDNVNLNN